LDPEFFAWQASPSAKRELKKILGVDDLSNFRDKIGQILCCDYYPATLGRSKAANVNPIVCGIPHGRGFKMRWAYPGCGKSGGIRLGILALCKARRIIVALACKRMQDPADSEFADAFSGASASSEEI
jgi:hypothetical protein